MKKTLLSLTKISVCLEQNDPLGYLRRIVVHGEPYCFLKAPENREDVAGGAWENRAGRGWREVSLERQSLRGVGSDEGRVARSLSD
jgi:hypothetical protein